MKKSNITSIIVAALIAVPAIADTAPAAATSEAKQSSVLDNISLSTFNEAHVTNFEELGSTGSGDAGEIFVYNSIGLGYKLSPTTKIAFSQRFNLHLNKVSAAGGNIYQQLDDRIGLSFSKVIQSGNYAMSSVGAQIELPNSQASANVDKMFALRAPVEQTYSSGRWTGTFTMIPKMTFYARPGTKGNDFTLDVIPSIAYQISSPLSTELAVENTFGYNRTKQNTTEFKNLDAYLYLRIQAFEKISVSPFVWFTPKDITAQSTTLGLEIAGSLL